MTVFCLFLLWMGWYGWICPGLFIPYRKGISISMSSVQMAGRSIKVLYSGRVCLPAPGNYLFPCDFRLLVRKLIGFGAENYTYAESSFHIDARWYQEPWVWLLGLCCLTAGIIGIVGLRTLQFQIRQHRLQRQIMEKTKELKLKNEELEKTDHIKTKLISIISHDLVTPLKFLHLAA